MPQRELGKPLMPSRHLLANRIVNSKKPCSLEMHDIQLVFTRHLHLQARANLRVLRRTLRCLRENLHRSVEINLLFCQCLPETYFL